MATSSWVLTPRTRSTTPDPTYTTVPWFLYIRPDWHVYQPYDLVFMTEWSISSITDSHLVLQRDGYIPEQEYLELLTQKPVIRSFKNVSHTRDNFVAHGVEQVTATDVSNPYRHYYYSVANITQYDSPASAVFLAAASIPSMNIGDLFVKAVTRITPKLERYLDTVNIYNMLYELRDVTKLVGLAKGILRMRNLDDATDAYIGTSFGAIPFFSDIQKIYNIFTRLDDVIDKWNEMAQKGGLLNEHEIIYSINEQDEVDYPNYGAGAPTYIGTPWQRSVEEKSILHIYYRAKHISSEQRSDAWLKAFGLDKLLVGIWDSIPFSWAIDYITNIGDMIEAYNTGIENMFQYELVDAGYSIKRKSENIAAPRYDWFTQANMVLTSANNAAHFRATQSSYIREQLDLSLFDNAIRKVPGFQIDVDLNLRRTSYLLGVGRILTRGK